MERTILAVCANRAPNQRVPEMAVKLAQAFDANLHLLYVISPYAPSHTLPYQTSSEEERSEARRFVQDFELRYGKEVRLVKREIEEGGIVKLVLEKCEQVDPFLIVVGRVDEKEIMLSMNRGVKRHLAKALTKNILLVK